MNTRSILLAYATRYGSTQEVAETITATLREAGLKVDMQPMQDVRTLDNYDAVVLGAAITMPSGTRMHTNSSHSIRKPSVSDPW